MVCCTLTLAATRPTSFLHILLSSGLSLLFLSASCCLVPFSPACSSLTKNLLAHVKQCQVNEDSEQKTPWWFHCRTDTPGVADTLLRKVVRINLWGVKRELVTCQAHRGDQQLPSWGALQSCTGQPFRLQALPCASSPGSGVKYFFF